MPSIRETTQVLHEAREGSRAAADRLIEIVYDEIHQLAAHRLRQERRGHTLQATALVHEVYLKLVDQTRVEWRDRAHFLSAAAAAIQRLLVDSARAHRADKRGAGQPKIALDEEAALVPGPDLDHEALKEALQRLQVERDRHYQAFRLHFYSGVEIREVARILGVSETTVKTDLRFARAWLRRELSRGEYPP